MSVGHIRAAMHPYHPGGHRIRRGARYPRRFRVSNLEQSDLLP